ncbi:MAG: helix-turn-helix domain-containing protein [Acutalibacter sp.]
MSANLLSVNFFGSSDSTFEIAEKWGISPRRVGILCNQGRIPGAQRAGSRWIIPEDAEKPTDARIKSGKYRKETR